mmetsp:Transcript_24383/g.57966  ORF Transcript_24383/g.57966 Transcript_24383/m.57966 type:complete len:282 (+) Transcript_24383:2063-2908(+)
MSTYSSITFICSSFFCRSTCSCALIPAAICLSTSFSVLPSTLASQEPSAPVVNVAPPRFLFFVRVPLLRSVVCFVTELDFALLLKAGILPPSSLINFEAVSGGIETVEPDVSRPDSKRPRIVILPRDLSFARTFSTAAVGMFTWSSDLPLPKKDISSSKSSSSSSSPLARSITSVPPSAGCAASGPASSFGRPGRYFSQHPRQTTFDDATVGNEMLSRFRRDGSSVLATSSTSRQHPMPAPWQPTLQITHGCWSSSFNPRGIGMSRALQRLGFDPHEGMLD